MSLTVTQTGLLDTIQDTGRNGYRSLGINPNGVMDMEAAIAANLLVGNPIEEAVIEMHFPASALLVGKTCLMAFTGADFNAVINGISIAAGHPMVIAAGSQIQFTKLVSGSRLYIAVQGGFLLQPWLHSNSTHLLLHKGGWEGRKLTAGDELSFKNNPWEHYVTPNNGITILPWRVPITEADATTVVPVIAGKEWNLLSEADRQNFLEKKFTISPHSNRMGYRITGEPLRNNFSIVSTAVQCGTIQLLPNGQMIILMADHQTTGGYPQIAHVISAAISRLAQLRPGSNVQFKMISIQEAEKMALQMALTQNKLTTACQYRLMEWMKRINPANVFNK